MHHARVIVNQKLVLLRPPWVVKKVARSRGLPLEATFPLLGVDGSWTRWVTRSRSVPVLQLSQDSSLSEFCHL